MYIYIEFLFLLVSQIIVDVPTVGGRLMLVDMAGSENIEQAGQTGLEAKMQVYIVDFFLLKRYG